MAEAWPSGLSYEPVSGSMRVPKPHRDPLRSDMDAGNERRRRLVTKNIATIQFELKLSNSEYEAFKIFERITLVDGTLHFTMPVWTGSGYETKTCRNLTYSDDPGDGFDHIISVTLDVEDY